VARVRSHRRDSALYRFCNTTRNNSLPRNYCIDIALLMVEQNNEVGQLMANLGEDRIVFGTGIPFHYAGPALTKLDLLDASQAVKDKIRWRNAEAWLKM
jgi:predicted TIM-barrel fold metal-dependent hydrolase